jgi:effector-binding domain-containing protein
MAPPPLLEERAAQPYLGIAAHVTSEAEFRSAADRGFPELFGWLQKEGVEPSGPPFIRYLELDAEGEPLEIELAVPTAAAQAAGGHIRADALPEGRYATFLHVGPYRSTEVPDLASARAELLDWAERQGVELESSTTDRGTRFRACVEHYITDPSRESDWSKWKTELAYLTTSS